MRKVYKLAAEILHNTAEGLVCDNNVIVITNIVAKVAFVCKEKITLL